MRNFIYFCLFMKLIYLSRSNSTKFQNQTELIYTVFVGGKPVLATTAAQDMKYVTQNEVAHVMEQMVYIKAERKFLSL